jgi:hypothetical protein
MWPRRSAGKYFSSAARAKLRNSPSVGLDQFIGAERAQRGQQHPLRQIASGTE